MTSSKESRQRPLAAARVVSSTPGRLRLRLPQDAARRDQLGAAAETLAGRPGVIQVETRWRTGSLLVEYAAEAGDAVRAALAELGLESCAASVARPAGDVRPEAAGVLRVLSRANALVAPRTGGTDLRTLVPVGLAMLALRQFVRGDQRLAGAPWYVLAWYASETFQKFGVQRGGEA